MKTFRNIISLSLITFLSGCGGDSKPIPTTVTGVFIDDIVQGLDYECSSGLSGKTNIRGEYVCGVGDQVTFSVNEITIGTTTAQSIIVSPYTFFPQNYDAAINLARLLQSIDNDGDSGNGVIQVNPDISLPPSLDFASPNFDTEVAIDLVSASIARQQLNENIVEHGGSVPAPPPDTTDPDTTDPDTTDPDTTDPDTTDPDTTDPDTTDPDTTDPDTTDPDTTSPDTTSPDTTGPDTSAPNAPTLLTSLLTTNQNTLGIEISGEPDASIWINNTQQGTTGSNGKSAITLDTSGEDGNKVFRVTLKDTSENESEALVININKDTVAPNINAKISKLQTADTSPALSGQLPSGDNDTDTTDYTVKILVNGVEYAASNDEDGNWELAANSLDMLAEGFYDVTVITTDAAGNTSSTVLTNAIEINNSGFLIDSALEGIKYVSGKYSGYTDKNGLFKYENDQEVRFYIGDESTGIELGSTKVKSDPFADRKVITVFDLAGSQDEENHVVINMGRFLQSLDSDNDVSNGILIDVRSKESIALLGLNNRIDFKSSTEDFAAHSDIESLFNDLAEHFGEHRGLISAEDAQAHLVSIRDNTLPVQKYGLETSRGNKEETVISTGIFKSTNGVVEGIDFRSGNQFGRTNEKGEFSYVEGGTVKFSIYELVLGTTQSKAVITPADMMRATSFNHPKPRNIIRLLNTFDADSTDDRISIDQAVRTALKKYRSQIDINLPDGRANEELGIKKGEDEFGAQFEDFELGQEILNEVNTLREEG